jgi:carboxymethylenebutenolidase
MALRDYLTTEVGEDWVDGLINRREAIRRLVLLGMSVASASALLAACASESASSGGTPTGGATTPTTTPPGAAPSSSAPSSAAPIAGEAITFAGPRGTLQGFFARAADPGGAILVIHENRGLTDHIRSVATRLAGDGFAALAIDLLSEEGGTAALGDSANVSAALGAAPNERFVADMRAGVDELKRRLPNAALAVTGFCFGGGMV